MEATKSEDLSTTIQTGYVCSWFVMGGSTSDINIESGCRNTQEVGTKFSSVQVCLPFVLQVFDLDNPSLGWQTENIDENYSCHSSSQIVTIDCG